MTKKIIKCVLAAWMALTISPASAQSDSTTRREVAAARESDSVNPERESSASQFYIVYGRRFNDAMLDNEQLKLDRQTGGTVKMTPEIREAYKAIGGTPHLDGQYTVFGEVIEGIDVVKEIDWADTDSNARPVDDIRIIKAEIVK